jgi:hypothetical protein
MITDVITVKIKIKDEHLAFEEKTDLIVSQLRSIAGLLEERKGDIQRVKGNDPDSSIEYVHVKKV